MNSLLSILVLSGLFLNIPLQMGIGIREIWLERKDSLFDTILECLIIFISTVIQWTLFSFVLSPLSLGFFKYFLLFPLNVMIPFFLKIVVNKIAPDYSVEKENVFLYSARSGAGIVTVILMLNLAETLTEALVLAMGFSLGMFFSVVILKAIRFRLDTERVNALFRGIPLLLISMGLLSLIITSVAAIYLSVQGTF